MKNIRNANRGNIKPHNMRLRPTDVSKQHEFYSVVARSQYLSALMASGIYGQVYQRRGGGTPCTCQPHESLLTDDGDLIATNLDNDSDLIESELSAPTFTATENEDSSYNGDSIENEIFDFGGFEQSQCACCYGTGFVGGYTLTHGYHECLNVCITDHVQNLDDRPVSYSEGTYATFECFLPSIANSTFTIRVWNKRLFVNDFTYSMPKFGVPSKIKVKTKEQFTHIEVFIVSNDPLYIDFDQLPDTLGIDMINDKGATTMHLPPDCGVTMASVIKDSKFNRTWEVTAINPHYDNHGKLIYVNCDVRLVGTTELQNSLIM